MSKRRKHDIPRLQLNLGFPFEVPEGWDAEFLTNAGEHERKYYEQAISTFDWDAAYGGYVKLALYDEATDVDGVVLKDTFSVWGMYHPDHVSERDKQLQREIYQCLKTIHDRQQKFADCGKPLLPMPPMGKFRPSLTPFWDYMRTLRAIDGQMPFVPWKVRKDNK